MLRHVETTWCKQNIEMHLESKLAAKILALQNRTQGPNSTSDDHTNWQVQTLVPWCNPVSNGQHPKKELIGRNLLSSFVSLTHPYPSYAHVPQPGGQWDFHHLWMGLCCVASCSPGRVPLRWEPMDAWRNGCHTFCQKPEVGGSRILYTPMRYMRYQLVSCGKCLVHEVINGVLPPRSPPGYAPRLSSLHPINTVTHI